MIRFIHLADVHLGAVPDRGCPWSHEREEEIWDTFRRVIAGIRKNPVDLLFIAGDLFHRQPLPGELEEVNSLFASIPDTRVFLMAGSHDYIRKESFYRDFRWESNVTFFRGETPECVEIPEKNVFVYGMSYEHPEISEPVYNSMRPQQKPGFHVLLAHGGDESHIPMDFAALTKAGFDYLALGYYHSPQIIMRDRALYAGALEPTDSNDTGEHGFIEGEYEQGILKTRLVPFACRSYQNLVLTVREESSQYSLEEMLRNDIMKRGGKNMYRIVIRGRRSPETRFLGERLKNMGNIVEVLDESRPSYDLEELRRKYRGTLIGDYIEYFRQKEDSVVEKKALYHGLQALLDAAVFTGDRKK
ncbi:metallophosphoesterase family protein [Blautia sp. HCP28S3_G10]|uniref:metallophosphoesterase family protein n=1 Tax=Blautia sp. HCP28S3_G10 TaxID=3438908 RepID=UPI003F8B14DD